MEKILIVDDSEFIRLFYADELSQEGFDVITTGGCKDFLGLVRSGRPDLIVMDIELGGCNGLDLLKEIRNAGYHMPVILCTAYPEYRVDLRSVAADYYVPKNSDLKDLKSKIKKALRGDAFHPDASTEYASGHKVVNNPEITKGKNHTSAFHS